MKLTEFAVTKYVSDDGFDMVSVRLTNADKSVTMYLDDFRSLMKQGVDPRWRLSNGQIIERGADRVCITRLIANAGKGQKVTLLDGDPCNLTRSNLTLSEGSGRVNPNAKLKVTNTARRQHLRKVSVRYNIIKPDWLSNDRV